MLVASVGYGTALDLGLTKAFADTAPDRLTFGSLEPLVSLMQETPVQKLLPALVEQLRAGIGVGELVKAAALANARTFGGEDYIGFHTMMALAPSLYMARELPTERQAMPVFKVLYRNTNRINEFGGPSSEVLHPVEGDALPDGRVAGELVQERVRSKDIQAAERTFAAIAAKSPEDAFNGMLYAVMDNTEVHRVVLPYRAWDMAGIIGKENAHTLLRQSLRYCLRAERNNRSETWDEPRTLLPKMLDQFKLVDKPLGDRKPDDKWVDEFSQMLFKATAQQAAEAAAAALAEGIAPDAIGEAISLAANQLVLRDHGRRPQEESPGKPVGSVHGDSIGVHACDSANAWRNMARVSNARNICACTILGAYQVALDRVNRGGDFQNWQPLPVPWVLNQVKTTEPEALLRELDEAIRGNLQARAATIAYRYGELDLPARPVFDLLLKYAISEDGALHAEKYYRTVTEEYATTRPAFRWRQVIALARVTASEYGRRAPGYDEAVSLLKV
jgi:hypothetical protein